MIYIVHYWELVLKWRNRKTFEKYLISSLESKLCWVSYKKDFWKLVIFGENKEIWDILDTTFWLSNYSFWYEVSSDINDIINMSLELLSNKNFNSFKVVSKRTNKSFPFNSLELSTTIWSKIVTELSKMVDLYNPDIVLYCEVWNNSTYIYTDKKKWLWWMPALSAWKVVSLLSWWIDSPVASRMMMKRWCENIFFHAYTRSMTINKIFEKIGNIVMILKKFQLTWKLYMYDFSTIQKTITANVPDSYRMLIFKRSLIRIATKIALDEWAKALICWDSLCQVASQSLQNLKVIYSASEDLPILSPLISMDKEDIIKISKIIWTYDISIQWKNDCCKLIAWNNPSTWWDISRIKYYEKLIDINSLENSFVSEMIVKEI